MTWICKDCGADTTPCTGKRGCRHKGKWEDYMVYDSVWHDAGMNIGDARLHGKGKGYLCIGCLESRLGRTLTPSDFTKALINDPSFPWHTPRLVARLTGLETEAA